MIGYTPYMVAKVGSHHKMKQGCTPDPTDLFDFYSSSLNGKAADVIGESRFES